MRHNGLTGHSPFYREKDVGVALNERDGYAINSKMSRKVSD